MKKISLLISAIILALSLLLPSTLSAATAVPWVADTPTSTVFSPSKLNGNNLGISVLGTASSFSGRVGIGTMSPLNLLHLSASSTGIPSLINIGNLAAPAVDTGSRIVFTGQSNTGQGALAAAWEGASTANSYLSFLTRQSDTLSEKMRITSTGNVGIGTTTPSQRLVVSGDILSTGTTTSNCFTYDGATCLTGSGGGIGGTISAGQVAFGTATDTVGGSSNLFWDSSTNRLGINNTSPSTLLEISRSGDGEVLRVSRSDSGSNFSLGTVNMTVNRATGSTNGMSLITDVMGSWGAGGGYIRFMPDNTEAMRILTNGNVGIGTTTPSQRLVVSGDILSTGTTTSNCFTYDGATCLTSNLGTVTSVAMSVPTGLQISGSPITSAGTLALSLASGYEIPETASTTAWQSFYQTPSTRISAGTGISWAGNTLSNSGVVSIGGLTGDVSTSSLGIRSSQWDDVTEGINYAGGKVGIGTTTPFEALTLSGNVYATGTIAASSFVPTSSTVPTNGMFLPAANTLGWGINGSTELKLNSTNLFPNLNDGLALGYGTTSFSDLFLSSGGVINWSNGNMTLTHSSASLNVGGGRLGVNDSTPDYRLEVASESGSGYFAATQTTDGDVFVIDTNENVGIATSTPSNRLSVGSGAIAVKEYQPATSTSMTIDWRNGNQQLVKVGTAAMSIGFSNHSPGQKLTVIACNGPSTASTISFTGVLWPGGTAPTHTTTANKCDAYSFLSTGATSTTAIFGSSALNF